MTNNVIDMTGKPYEQEPPETRYEPILVRVTLEQPPTPAITPLGVLVAVLCAVGSFVLLSAVLV